MKPEPETPGTQAFEPHVTVNDPDRWGPPEENEGAANAGDTAPRPEDSAGSQTGTNVNTLRPKDKFNAKLPKSIRDYIDNPPKPGEGFHLWVFGVALRLQGWRPDDVIEEILKVASDTCGEPRDPREIPDAMKAAARVAEERVTGAQSQVAGPVAAGKGGCGGARSASAWPDLDEAHRRKVIDSSVVKCVLDLEQRSPRAFLATEETTAEDFVESLFPGNPLICAGATLEEAHTQPLYDWYGRLGGQSYIVPNKMTARSGVNQKGRESKRCIANTGPRIYIVVEADVGTYDEQAAVIWHLANFAPLVIVVNSGGKSLHAWFRCEGVDEGDVRRFMEYAVRLGADRTTMSRCQMVRMPFGRRFKSDRTVRQEVHYFNPELVKAPPAWRVSEIPPCGAGLANLSTGGEFDDDCEVEEVVEYPIPGGLLKQLKTDLAGRYNEAVLAKAVLEILPPISTCGDSWHYWDGSSWVKCVRERFLPTVMRLLAQVGMSTIARAKRILEHVCGLQQWSGEWNGCYAAAGDDRVLINVANGVLRVDGSAVELLNHNPDYRFTYAISTAWDPLAQCDVFLATLGSALPDPLDRELFECFAGYILEPSAKHEVALAIFGPGGTGKSTLVNDGIGHALGGFQNGAVTQLALKQLCDSGAYSLPKIRHALVNILAEGDALEVQESANFKSIISGEPLLAREIWGSPFVMTPTCKLLIASNHLPRFRNGTDAEGRRLRLLHFNQVPSKPDLDLKTKIRSESTGILRWMVGGLQILMRRGAMPWGGEAAKPVSERFGISNDPLGHFIKTACVLAPDAEVSKQAFFDAYAEFAEENGFSVEHISSLGRKLVDRFVDIKTVRHRRERFYRGVGLREWPPDDDVLFDPMER